MTTILLLNGPNLNLLGEREPGHYGTTTLKEIEDDLRARAAERDATLECFQSNHEGSIIDKLQEVAGKVQGLVINPAGLSHTSVVLRDAVAALGVPTVEVHISNVYSREAFRHKSLVAPVATGQVVGLGTYGYVIALLGLLHVLQAGKPHGAGKENRFDVEAFR